MRLTIAKKLWLGFSTLNVLLLIAGAFAIFSFFNLTSKYQTILDENVEKINIAKGIEKSQIEVKANLLDYVSYNSLEAVELVNDSLQQGEALVEKFKSFSNDDESITLLERVSTNFKVYTETNQKVIEMKGNGKPYISSLGQLKLHSEQIGIYLAQLVELQQQNVEKAKAEIKTYQSTILTVIFIIIIVSIVLGIGISVIISRNISNPIKKVTNGLESNCQWKFIN